MLQKIKALIVKEGHTPLGKAVEHAVVAGLAVGVSLLVESASAGHLALSDVQAAAVAAGTAVLAGLRAALKARA